VKVRGVDDGATLGDPAQGIEEFLDMVHAVLQEIADPCAVARVEQLGCVAALHLLTEDEDGQRGAFRAQGHGGAQPFVGRAGRHADVRHHDVRVVLGDGGLEALRVADRGGHVVPEAGEQTDEAFTQHNAVLGED
jgi:hypothetical protein